MLRHEIQYVRHETLNVSYETQIQTQNGGEREF